MRKVVGLGGILLGSLMLAGTAHGYANTPQIDPSYNNRIVDDGVFLNVNSMSVQDIQNFLNAKVPTCDTNHQGGNPNQPPPYTCLKDYVDPTTNKKAAQLIYDEATAVGLNPEVVLVTLEKEEGLVTDTWPYPSQYKTAMGYGCPESQSVCDSQYYGFYNQVHLGVRLLRAGLARDCGDTTTLSNWTVSSQWQIGNSPAVDGVPTYLANCATGSLYNYTPHRPDSAYTARNGVYYYGNYNFITYFNSWFGSTWGSPLIKSNSSAAIYLLDGTTIYQIPSYDVMKAFGLYGKFVNIVQDSTIQSFTNGGTLSTTIKWTQDGTVFLVDSGKRYTVPDSTTCTNWALSCFDSGVTKTLSASFVNTLVSGGALQPLQENNGAVYLMSNGTKEPILDGAKLASLGYTWSNVVHMDNVNSSQALGPLLMSNGTVIKFPPSAAILIYDDNSFHLVPDFNILTAWGLGAKVASNPIQSSYNATPPSTTDSITPIAKDASNRILLLDNGTRKDITAQASNWPTDYTTTGRDLLANMPLSTLGTLARSASGNIFTISGSKKHNIPSMNDFYGMGLSLSNLVNLSDYSASLLPDGTPSLADGTIFQPAGDSGIYIANAGGRIRVPGPSYFGYYNLNWAAVENLSSAALSLPDNGTLSILVKDSSGQEYTVFGGHKFRLSSQNLSDWGLSNASAQALSDGVLNRLPSDTLTTFLRTPNGAIYKGQGGSAHLISSYASFVQMGGTAANTMNISSEFIALCPSGSPL